MRILYLDCSMGAAGDMLTAALYELVEDKHAFMHKMQDLGLPGIEMKAVPSVKCGITGTHMQVFVHGKEEMSEDVDVTLVKREDHHSQEENHHDHHHHNYEEHGHHHHHHGTGMHEIKHILSHLSVSEKVRNDVIAVYEQIANAECEVHGKSMEEIHFHEVGTMDAVTDVTAVCLLMEELQIDKVIASPIHVGSGQVKCAHGILPVPAPATAKILKDIPIYGGTIKGELCTPTGAALLKHFVTEFGPMPMMKMEQIGHGMGNKDFEAANCVTAYLGETSDIKMNKGQDDYNRVNSNKDCISELSCNIDDMTAEEIGFSMEELLKSGALDVFTTPIGMKKGRPATMLTCLCKSNQEEEMSILMLKCTNTIGVRVTKKERYVLDRQTISVETSFGTVRKKISKGYGITKEKWEYEDLAAIARKENLTLSEVKRNISI